MDKRNNSFLKWGMLVLFLGLCIAAWFVTSNVKNDQVQGKPILVEEKNRNTDNSSQEEKENNSGDSLSDKSKDNGDNKEKVKNSLIFVPMRISTTGSVKLRKILL